MDANTAAAEAFPMDTSNQQTAIISAWVVMTVLAAVTVGMRFYTRRLILHVLGPEDWLILISMVLSVGTCIGFVRQTFFGLGRHVWTVTPEMMMQWKLEQFYSFIFYTMSLALAKLSILFLYMRIMTHGPHRIAVYVVLGIVVACNIWVFINNFIQCIPLESIWNPDVKGTCLGLAVTIGNSVLHIITDFFIFILPLPALAKLKINKKQKISLMLVFSLGFFVCLISIIRMASISRLDFADLTYNFAVVAYWGAAEVNLAIICACLTTLKPLIVRLFPKLLGSTATNKTHGPTAAARSASAAAAGNTHGQKSQRRTLVVVEERKFARLRDDGESVSAKSSLEGEAEEGEAEEGASTYELVSPLSSSKQEGKGVARPGRTYPGPGDKAYANPGLR